MTGYVDNASTDAGLLHLGGWAAASDLSRPVDRVVIVAGDESVAAAEPSGARPDVVRGYGGKQGLARSGFSVDIPLSAIDCSDGELALIGIVDGVGAPLKPLGGVGESLAEACR